MIGVFGTLAACSKELPPRTVSEFRDNPILLEATMVHCAQDRSIRKYEVECVNAREAINLIAREEDEASRAQLEAQSERKRRALRRAQEAAAQARRRAAEADKQRIEAEYLGNFDAIPGEQQPPSQLQQQPPSASGATLPTTSQPVAAPAQPVRSDSAPVVEEEAAPAAGSDLDAIRRELERRQN